MVFAADGYKSISVGCGGTLTFVEIRENHALFHL